MRVRLKTLVLAIAVLLAALFLQTAARADNFQFTLATDPVGCGNFSGGCGLVSAQGIFATDPLTLSPQFGNSPVFPVESIVGKFDGFNVALNNPGQSAILQSTLNLLPFGPGLIFSAGGQQFELEFNEGTHPTGSDNLLFNFSNNTFKSVTLGVTPVGVPEPSELALAAAGLLGLAGVKLFKSKTA